MVETIKTGWTATPLECLQRALKRDAERGGDGSRNTREVADYCGLTMAQARRQLWALVKAGDIDAFDGGASGAEGNPILWRIKAAS